MIKISQKIKKQQLKNGRSYAWKFNKCRYNNTLLIFSEKQLSQKQTAYPRIRPLYFTPCRRGFSGRDL
jgi:hypothetical protein